MRAQEFISEKWSRKYKSSINCARPRGFSQKAHCASRNKNEDVTEDLNEAIGGNYLYHATNSLKDILASGQINKSDFQKQQDATRVQTTLPTFSVTRDWNYAVGGQGTGQVTGTIGRSAIIVLDRNAVESNFKTLGTSQTSDKLDLRGAPHPGNAAFAYDVITKRPDDAYGKKLIAGRKKAATPDNTIVPTNKIGQEFEEVVVVPKGSMPIKGTMVGFYIPPSSSLMKDPAVVNDPRRLDLAPGGTGRFVKAAQQQGVAENKRVARKSGQPADSKKHSDLYTDENPRGTITGLKFATVADARASVSKIRNSGRSHAHKIQAAVAMEQRARAAGKSEEAAVYRGYINANKKTDENVDLAEDLRDWFGKGKGGGAGGGGWDRYNTKGERIGKCGDRKPGEGKPKCLSKSRAASLRSSGGKSAIASAVRRKRAKDKDPERSGQAQNVASRAKKS